MNDSIYNFVPIGNFAHMNSNAVVSDVLNWTLISGSFVADSAYTEMMLGNFFDDAHTTVANTAQQYNILYYYIDNVCVSTDSLECDLNTSTHHQAVQSNLSIYPTISHQAVTITFPQGSTQFNIFNTIGQSVYNNNVTSLRQAVDVSQFSEGIYFVRVQTHQGVQTAKFVVQHR